MLKQRTPGFSISNICKAYNRTPQAFYWSKRHQLQQSINEDAIVSLSKVIRATHPAYGLRKLHYCIRQQGLVIGRDRLRTLLYNQGLLFKPRKSRRFVMTTNSTHHYRLYPNLIRNLDIRTPEQVWVADITAVYIKARPYFLAIVADAYSRKIMGWEFGSKNTAQLTCTALSRASENRHYPQKAIIHHSDRGSQYCCNKYRQLLEQLNMTVSTTETGDPRENAIVERIFRTLKKEYGLEKNFNNYQEAITSIEHSILVYNHLRIHYACQLKTPDQAHKTLKSPFF